MQFQKFLKIYIAILIIRTEKHTLHEVKVKEGGPKYEHGLMMILSTILLEPEVEVMTILLIY